MKVQNILESIVEDVQVEKRLDVIADQLLKAVRKVAPAEAQKRYQNNSLDSEDINYIGKLGDLVDAKILGPFYKDFKNIHFGYVISRGLGHVGVFYPDDMSLVVNYPLDPEFRTPFARNKVHSTLVHELKHIRDFIVSKGKAFDQGMTRHASDISSDEISGEYDRDQSEISARTSEAMLEVRRYIVRMYNGNHKIDNNILRDMIIDAMKENNLIKIFKSEKEIPTDNKGFRQIFNKILSYAQNFIKQLPKSS